MDHDRAFREAIQDHPDDDFHRLAWADWLEENGQETRAAFVRAALRATALPHDDPARDAAEDEADDLLAAHETEWAGRAGELALEWRWHRGGIDHVTVWADTLLDHGDELFRDEPIRSLRLLADSDDLVRLADCPYLGRVSRLVLGTGWYDSPFLGPYHRDRALLGLLSSRHLDRLTELDLRGQGVEGPVVRALSSTGLLDRLVKLDLSNNRGLGDRAVRHLVEAGADRLEELALLQTNLTTAGLRSLLAAQRFPVLRTLEVNLGLLVPRDADPGTLERDLVQAPLAAQLTSWTFEGVSLAAAELERLLNWPPAAQLRSLTLKGCWLGEAEAQVLALANLAQLRRLHLPDNQLRDRGGRALAGSPSLGRLTALELGNNGIAGPGLRALLASSPLAGLTRLDLSGNHAGLPAVEALTRTPVPRRLTWLHLGGGNLDAEAAVLLADSPALSRLRVLWLNGNRLGDDGVRALASSPHLPRLVQLHLDSNGIDSPGALALLETPYLQRVRHLSMRNAFITSSEREQLRARYGAGTQF